MKLKTLIKLVMIKGNRPDLIIHHYNQDCDFDIYDYISFKDTEVLDWTYIPGDASENENDKIIIYV